MTNEDKQLIADYMTWEKDKLQIGYWRPVDNDLAIVNFDLNDAGLCVAEIQKRGEWWGFFDFISSNPPEGRIYPHEYVAWLFVAENFFGAMSAWIKEGKK